MRKKRHPQKRTTMLRDMTTDILRLLLTPQVGCTITTHHKARHKAHQQDTRSIQQLIRHMLMDTRRIRHLILHIHMTPHTNLRMIRLHSLLALRHLQILMAIHPEKQPEKAVM